MLDTAVQWVLGTNKYESVLYSATIGIIWFFGEGGPLMRLNERIPLKEASDSTSFMLPSLKKNIIANVAEYNTLS